MAERITDAFLEASLEIVNHYTRAAEGEPGWMVFHRAYGQIAVRQLSPGGGARTISALMTKREVANFLDGMLAAYRSVEDILLVE